MTHVQLLPPYGEFFKTILDANGALLVQWTRRGWILSPHLAYRVTFFGEHRKIIYQDAGLAEEISSAVLRVFAANGIGVKAAAGGWRPPASLAELSTVPAYTAILSLLDEQAKRTHANSSACSESASEFRSYAAAPSRHDAKRFLRQQGFQVLLWLRHLNARVYLPKTPLVDAGLPAAVLEHAAAAAVSCWRSRGKQMTSDEQPYVPSVQQPQKQQHKRRAPRAGHVPHA